MDQLSNESENNPGIAPPLPNGGRRLPLITRHAFTALGTAVLLALCTWGLIRLRATTGEQRPYTILYLIPVAIGAALMGARGGALTALLALILARVYLFNDAKHGSELFLTFPHPNEAIEFLALFAGTVTVALVTGRLRSALGLLRRSGERVAQANQELGDANHRLAEANVRLEDSNLRLADANDRLRESEEQRRVFHRDVLMAVTGGKLRLVEPDEMPPPDLASGAPTLTLPLEEAADASRLRRTLQKIAEDGGMDVERIYDLCTGTTEAATNAIKHGSGGQARVWTDAHSVVVEIADRGCGIAPAQLARATLQQGYSTRVSLGMGFHLMLQTSDVLALSTTPKGTSILLRVATGPRVSEEESLLARYVAI